PPPKVLMLNRFNLPATVSLYPQVDTIVLTSIISLIEQVVLLAVKNYKKGGLSMAPLKRVRSRGFTIVELLIVIVVIGILAVLVALTYNGIKQKERDTERKDDVKTLHGRLEAYQAQNGKYPTLANVNDATWRSTNMKGLDIAALQDPKGPTAKLVASPAPNAYAYAVSPANCDNGAAGDCTSYTLTATLEGGGTYVKQSLN
ncbi:hypothetical protein BVY00_01935, partial [bacterium G20]